MEAQAYLWHYIVMGVLLALFGVVAHVSRAVFNLYPDRLSDKPTMDMLISDGYDLGDRLFGTEYDDAGYYRLDSLRNLRIAVSSTVIGGFVLILIMPNGSGLMAYAVNEWAGWLWDLFLYRLEEAGIL
jgi:hypothetical protein